MRKHIFSGFLVLGLVFPLLTAATTPQSAESKSFICEDALRALVPFTLPHLSKMAREDIAEARKIQPVRNYFSLDEEMQIVRKGITGPKTLQAAIGNLRFMSVPTAHSPTDVSIGKLEEGLSMPLRVDDLQWEGRPAGTLVYVNLPYNLTPQDSKYMIGPQYEHVAVFSHGVGTQQSRAETSILYGNVLAKRGIPLLAFDLPGHGDGPIGDVLLIKSVADWLAEAIDRLVDPRVNVSLNFGHSGGAMLAMYMRNHSVDNPKYERILKAMSIAPAIDTSLGGDIKQKLEFERWYAENYHTREKDISPKDKEFLDKQTENDKYSIVGLIAAIASFIDFRTPVIPVEEQRKLIPLKVVVGEGDGVVYVTREEPFNKALGNLNEVGNGSELRILKPGPTHRSKTVDDVEITGHQAMEVEDPITRTSIVNKMIYNFILGDAESARPEGPVTKANVILTQITHHYSHFIPFRKLLENYVRYKRVPTSQLKIDSERRDRLIAYIEQAHSIRNRMGSEKEVSKAIKAKMGGFGIQFGIEENIGFKQAQDELSFSELTPERKTQIETFLAKVKHINDVEMVEWQDPQTANDREAFWKMHLKTFEEANQTLPVDKQITLEKLENYKDAWLALKEKDKGVKFTELGKEEQKEYRKRDSIRKGLATVDREFLKLLENARKRYGDERFRRIDKASPQDDIKIPQTADRELIAGQRSPEERKIRNEALRAFIAAYPGALEEAKSSYQAIILAEINKLTKPENISNIAEAETEARKIEDLQNLMYAVPGEPELQTLAAEIQAITKEKKGLPDNFNAVIKLKQQRMGYVKKLADLWKENKFTSPRLISIRAKYNESIKGLKATLRELGAAVDTYLRTEYEKHGTINRAMIENRPQSMRDIEKNLFDQRNYFLRLKKILANEQMHEALMGHLGNSPEAKEAQKLALELSLKNPDSISSKIATLEKPLEEQVARESLLTQRREFLQWQYAKLMKEKGYNPPYEMVRIDAYKLVDQELADYYEMFESNPYAVSVLDDLLNAWTPMLSYMRDTNVATED